MPDTGRLCLGVCFRTGFDTVWAAVRFHAHPLFDRLDIGVYHNASVRAYRKLCVHCSLAQSQVPIRLHAMNDNPKPFAFSFTQDVLADLADRALQRAQGLGASAVQAEVSEGCGMSVAVRMGEIENIEHNRDKSLGVTVYIDKQRGNAHTSDFSEAAVVRTVQAAYDIARFTAQDPACGLPEVADLVSTADAQRDLQLYHPWDLSSDEAIAMANACEASALKTDVRLKNSDGASVSLQQGQFFSAMQQGSERIFAAGYPSSRHSISVAPIGIDAQGNMQRDYWFSSKRDPQDLDSPEQVGTVAAQRVLRRLEARQVPTCTCPVLFDPLTAVGLLGSYVQAVSGGALYRNSSFLQDSMGKRVFAGHIAVWEDPFVLKGNASSPFDDEGARVRAQKVIDDGVVQSYFLSSYSARKLGMKTTGHAGGSHNLFLRSSNTEIGDDLDTMLRKLHRGLFVTELMGQGVNPLTGDYSRGASGFWVENGAIAHPVEEVTIAGNLRDMFAAIAAIGADIQTLGSKTSGSVLIDSMRVAGS